MVVVHAASIQDRDGAKLVMERIRGKFARLKLIWADGGYQGKLLAWVHSCFHYTLAILNVATILLVFPCYPVAGWLKEPLAGWAAIVD